MQKVLKNNSISLDIDSCISDEQNSISIARKLFDAIEECKSSIKSIKRITNLNTQLSQEIDLLTSRGNRDEYLQAAYSYPETILSKSVDCERCFSTASYVDY